MTDHRERADRHPTDEPDGTPAHAASLRPPGDSVANGADEEHDDGGEAGPDAGARYDVGAVSGDTDAYRPE
jgi:hypothetical protein